MNIPSSMVQALKFRSEARYRNHTTLNPKPKTQNLRSHFGSRLVNTPLALPVVRTMRKFLADTNTQEALTVEQRAHRVAEATAEDVLEPAFWQQLGERRSRAELNARVAAKSLALRGVFRGATSRGSGGAEAKSSHQTKQLEENTPEHSASASGSTATRRCSSLEATSGLGLQSRSAQEFSYPSQALSGYNISGELNGISTTEAHSVVPRTSTGH